MSFNFEIQEPCAYNNASFLPGPQYAPVGDDNTARLLFEKLLLRDPGYLGSYYHLGKLSEREGDYELAILTYKAGMGEAQKAGDKHSHNELELWRK